MAKIVIVGGGVAGLSAGIHARLGGHDAVICERGAVAGGNLTGWTRGGYHIDNCIHWLTGTNPASKTYKIWETLGALDGTEIVKQDTLYTYEHTDGTAVSLKRDLSATKKGMLRLASCDSDIKEICDFADAVRAVMLLSNIDDTAGKKVSVPRKAGAVSHLYKYYRLTTGELSERFKSPALRGFINCFLGDDFGSLALVTIFAHFCGSNGDLPRGGSTEMASKITNRFLSLGGRLMLNSEVKKINVDGRYARSVTLADGTLIDADYVIVTADPMTVFGKMLPAPMPYGLSVDYKNRRAQRFSAIQCAFSSSLLAPPFNGDIIFEIPDKYKEKLRSRNLIIREFSHEPSFSPKGNSLLQTMIFCDENDAKALISLKKTDKAIYDELKYSHAQTVKKVIDEHFSDIDLGLECIDVWTPATYKSFVASDIGSFMSFTLPSKYLPFRTNERVRGIDNLILATQWQQAPGGLPIAAGCGIKAIRTVEALERREHKTDEQYSKVYTRA